VAFGFQIQCDAVFPIKSVSNDEKGWLLFSIVLVCMLSEKLAINLIAVDVIAGFGVVYVK
jgi:hypothetical protein